MHSATKHDRLKLSKVLVANYFIGTTSNKNMKMLLIERKSDRCRSDTDNLFVDVPVVVVDAECVFFLPL